MVLWGTGVVGDLLGGNTVVTDDDANDVGDECWHIGMVGIGWKVGCCG